MSEVLDRVDTLTALAGVHHALDALQAADPGRLSGESLVSAVREFERARRRLEAVDHALILAVEEQGLPGAALSRGSGPWLRQTLTIDITEATTRVRAAHAAGTRHSLVGEPLTPKYPAVAAAQAAGVLAARQARVITSTLDRLPEAVLEEVPAVEARLVGFAKTFDATSLQKLADRERDWLDPDGTLGDVEKRRRDRDVRCTQRPDGSCTGSFEGTAELGELLQVAFDSLGAPKPEFNGVKDPRSAGQAATTPSWTR